ncbi:NAD(P)/FAD-dependent oxidoreductase, partial [Candidatus Parcubacteria bacterium]|nr:NAD(P)/FAD-dependent oxidoreductase [Candidatus Parcubacteria bacterium]
MKKYYDAIIVGSGLGGLSAGAILAKNGKNVLILEKHCKIGGYATSFKRKGFPFDVALHQTGGINKTFYKDILKACGIYDRLKFIKHKYLYESIDSDSGFELEVKNGDVNDLKKKLIEQFPEEKWGIRLWFFLIEKIGKETYRLDKAMATNDKISRGIFLCFAPLLIPFLMVAHKISAQRILNICARNKELQLALMQLKGYYGDNLDIACLLPFVGNYGYYFDGGYYIKGGGQSVSTALKAVIEENGGKALANTEAVKILVKNDVAIGVETINNQIFYGEKIIASASPFIVYEELLKDWKGSKRELEKINKMEIGTSLSQIYLGLNCPIKQINEKFKDSYLVFLNNLKDDFYKDIILAFHSNVDLSATPEGNAIICITFPDNYKRWDGLSKEEYREKKNKELKKIYGLLQKYLPDLESYIEESEFATPKTMERYTGN